MLEPWYVERTTDVSTLFYVRCCVLSRRSQVIGMNVVKQSFGDMATLGGDKCPPCTGFTPDALPEVQEPVLAENSQTGVSA